MMFLGHQTCDYDLAVCTAVRCTSGTAHSVFSLGTWKKKDASSFPFNMNGDTSLYWQAFIREHATAGFWEYVKLYFVPPRGHRAQS